jgi:glycosyltransferase involved in cell wall biosynthesis
MRILFLTQYYPPETGAAQNRLSDLARRLTALGHCVTVLTAMPNYPQGEIFREYRGRLVRETIEDGVRVIRTWIYATKSKRFLPRITSYVSFTLMSAVVGLTKFPDQHFVIVESPPLFVGCSGLLLSRLKRAKLVTNISDLWPKSAVALGVLREGLLFRLATRLEEHVYRRSVFVTGQTDGIVDNIRRRIPEKSVVLLPNGVSRENIVGDDQRPETARRVRQEFGLDGHFVVGYTGLHGLAQGLETLLEAAKLLGGAERIVFAFFGDGPDKERLVRFAQQNGLESVRFFPPQPAARMPEVFTALDAAIVPLRRNALFRGARPSKLLETMGAAIPVILSIEGEAQAIVDNAQAGICVEPENPRAMVDAILKLCADPSLCRLLGQNGRRYVTQHFDRAQVVERLTLLLTTAMGSQRNQKACEDARASIT